MDIQLYIWVLCKIFVWYDIIYKVNYVECFWYIGVKFFKRNKVNNKI